MIAVLNKPYAGIPAGARYIGRGRKWSNRFQIAPTVTAQWW
jgi:hypothetical protein